MLNKKTSLLVCLFFTVFVLSNCLLIASVQSPGGKLLGFIYKSNKKTPLNDARVVLTNTTDGSRYESNITDDNGDYKIENLPDGNYKVHLEIKDKEYKIKKLDFIVKIDDGKVSFLSFAVNKAFAPFIIIPVGTALAYTIGSELILPDPDPASPTVR